MNIEDIKVGRDMTTKERLEELVKDYELMRDQSEKNAQLANEVGELHRESYCQGALNAERAIIDDLRSILKDLK